MIGDEVAAFLQEGIAIQLGTRNAGLEPNGARAIAVAVEADRVHVTAFVPEVAAAGVLPDLESNGQVALVFARPPDERACQLKGTFAGWRPATDAEHETAQAQWSRWLDRLGSIGLSRRAVQHWTTSPCIAIRVRVNAIYNQTPGPGAGAQVA